MLCTDISDAVLGQFWWYFSLVMLVLMVAIAVWAAIGGRGGRDGLFRGDGFWWGHLGRGLHDRRE